MREQRRASCSFPIPGESSVTSGEVPWNTGKIHRAQVSPNALASTVIAPDGPTLRSDDLGILGRMGTAVLRTGGRQPSCRLGRTPIHDAVSRAWGSDAG